MGDIPVAGLIGPAQSDELVHFTGKEGCFTAGVPDEVRRMTPSERLDAILGSRLLRGFPPFGDSRACVCFSESPLDHLAHLITVRGFSPWGIVLTLNQMLDAGGGSVSYVPTAVRERFVKAGLGHWAVRTDTDSSWMHEREWRLPLNPGFAGARLDGLAAILVGDPTWRPSLVGAGDWINRATGEPCQPGEDPFCEESEDFPKVWQESEIWVWDKNTQQVVRHPPGTPR
ncbi:hypothetical protein [Streptomyces sp. NPDC087525]|uniref:hypothetical protein n=1 Tax=Streptomyces sp. NPDC087525 TaxID=3365793 RepID=UPI00380F953B